MSGTSAASYRGVSVQFGVTRALRDLDLEIAQGTIHALVGENGAGKSTALGVLAGRVAPTVGDVLLFGQRLAPERPRESRRLGIAAIYQELTIAPELDATANVFAGQERARAGFVATRRMRAEYVRLAADLGVPAVPAGVPAGRLSVAEQQLLEIMRAMASDAKLILFDEPTAALGIHERQSLLALMRRMRSEGRTLVFVSHNLEEVLEIADTVSVFRSGSLVSTRPRADVTKRGIIRDMLGEYAEGRLLGEDDRQTPARATTPVPSGEALLRVEGLSVPGAVEDIALEVHAGEVLGLGGLVGAGRTSVLRALAGAEPRASGRMWIDGAEVSWPRTVRQALALGIALAPEDRKAQGLVLEQPAALNVAMGDLRRVARFGWVSERRLRSEAQRAVVPFGFDPTRIAESPSRLSGGNQQKLLLARWKYSEPRILLADEPTRGIDIGAKEDVLEALRDMAARGLAIVVVSSELEELVAVSDRIDVLAEGRVVGRLGRDDDRTVTAILSTAFKG